MRNANHLARLFVTGMLALGASVTFAAASASPTETLSRYGRLPMHFEANAGQADAEVRFLARGSGYAVYLTADGAVLSLRAAGPGKAPATIRMHLPGAKASAQMTGVDEQAGRSHYFLGNDPERWVRDVPTYARVRYTQVHPGIDLVLYGNQRQLEYDFVVAPGADPGVIRLAFEGASKLDLDESGDLILRTPSGDLRHHRPVVYQEIDGTKRMVEGSYIRTGEQEVGFRVAAYDARFALVIDPVLSYSTFLGGTKDDRARAIAVDASGNTYVIGDTQSTDFPVAGALQPGIGRYFGVVLAPDIFVTKLNAAGSAIVYSTYLGGDGFENGRGIAVDGSGNAYIAGVTYSTNFPTAAPAQATPGDNGFFGDMFVAKLNPAGSGLVFSTYLGGSGVDLGLSLQFGGNLIAVDAAGNAYVTGETGSTNFPVSPGAFQATLKGSFNAFVTKFGPSGSRLYSTYLGGTNVDSGNGIAVDASGNAHVTGSTTSIDFPKTPGAYSTTTCIYECIFVSKVNATGNALAYSAILAGGRGQAIALDGATNAYLTGYADWQMATTAGAYQAVARSGLDAFVAKLNPTGSAFVYATFLGGNGNDQGWSIAVDASGQAHVAGDTNSADFPVTAGAVQPVFGGGSANFSTDAFAAKLNATGTGLLYSTYLGGAAGDAAYGIAVDASGNACVAGTTLSANFPTASAIQPGYAGSGGNLTIGDAFVARLALADVAGRLGNISTRGQVLTGDNVMIGGFIIGGSVAKTVLIRARGPSMIPAGVLNALANPTLTLVNQATATIIGTNDNWGEASNAGAITATGKAPTNAFESAILTSLNPGAYTAVVSGVGGGTGVGIVEVFEIDQPAVPLTNISTRGRVLTGDDVMIGGFIIDGSGPQTVLIRARGPSMIPAGVTDALPNPQVVLVNQATAQIIATNDNWGESTNASAITATGLAPTNSFESAILITLQPGAYTAVVSGVGGTTGVGIVEVFAQ